jgi:hypothetical protein
MVFRLDFSPKRHGWHFANDFVNNILPGITTRGLCGGMAATAWDYYAAGLPIPSHRPADFPDGPTGSHVPQTGTPLREYIYQRQMATLQPGNPVHIGRWLLLGDISKSERFHKDVRDVELPKLRKRLEVERTFGIVGLFSPKDGNPFGHQVLAYGFDGDGILVYDSNHPDKEVVIAPTTNPDARQAFSVSVDGTVVDHYRGWFFMDFAYDPHNPVQPPYRDLVVSQSIRVEESAPRVGDPLHISYTIDNAGQTTAHVDQLYVWIRKDGANRDDLAGGGDGNSQPIPPGGRRTIRTGTNAARGPAGAYQAGASYLLDDVWRDLPAAQGATARVDFGLAPAADPWTGWRDLGGVLTSDVDAGVQADGKLSVFGVGLDGRIWFRRETSPGTWAEWDAIGSMTGFVGRPTVARSKDDRLEVFGRTAAGELWHVWQTTPNGGWSGWEKRGDRCTTDAAAALNADGRMELFVTRDGGQVFHAYQRWVFGPWSGLEPLQGGSVQGPLDVARNADGRLEVVGRGHDRGIWHVWQTTPNGGWENWASLGGLLRNAPTVCPQSNGLLEVYATGDDSKAWHVWQKPDAPTGWTGWSPYGGVTVPSDARYTADVNSTGGVSLFVRGTGGDVLERHHIAQEPWWSDWRSVGGATVGDPVAVRRPNGKLALFTRGTTRNLVHREF